MGLTFDHDGKFWMSYPDFIARFDHFEMCRMSPYLLSEEYEGMSMTSFTGTWTKDVSAGGCRNHLASFWSNPMHVMTLQDSDEDDGMCTVFVGLKQQMPSVCPTNCNVAMDFLTIGYAIFRVSEGDLAQSPLKMNFFKQNVSVARSVVFVNAREVGRRFRMAPGHYLIVPSTFEPGQEAKFLLRIFRIFNTSERKMEGMHDISRMSGSDNYVSSWHPVDKGHAQGSNILDLSPF